MRLPASTSVKIWSPKTAVFLRVRPHQLHGPQEAAPARLAHPVHEGDVHGLGELLQALRMDGVGGDADLDAFDFQFGQPLDHAGRDLIMPPGHERVVQVRDDGP